MKFLKRLLLVLALLLLGATLFCIVSLHKLHSRPAFYRPVTFSDRELEDNAHRAENSYLEMRNLAERPSGEGDASPAARRQDFVFSEDQLNAVFIKWSDKFKEKYERHVQEPRLVLEDGKIILVGLVKSPVETILSVHIEPKIDPRGQLLLDIVAVQGGTMPLPHVAYGKPEQQLKDWLTSRLPALQSAAQLVTKGRSQGWPNDAAVEAALSELLLNTLNHQPSPPAIFLKDPIEGKKLPARLVGVKVEDQHLRLTVEPMTLEQRQELVQRIRAPYAAGG